MCLKVGILAHFFIGSTGVAIYYDGLNDTRKSSGVS